MKTFKILSVICASAVLFGWTACMDTDAQYTAADAPAPTFIGIICDQQDTLTTSSNTLSTGQQIYPGNHTVALLFDENIGFATSTTNQITLNGNPVNKAVVYGASNALTIEFTSPAVSDTMDLRERPTSRTSSSHGPRSILLQQRPSSTAMPPTRPKPSTRPCSPITDRRSFRAQWPS